MLAVSGKSWLIPSVPNPHSLRGLHSAARSNTLSHSIEDNILITKSGHENLTTAVKDVSEMEKIISSS